MSVSERNHQIVVAGAGYAGLHVAMRLASRLRDNLGVQLTLVDRHDFHQVMTELPRVAGGTGLRTPSASHWTTLSPKVSTSWKRKSPASTWPASS